MPPSLCAVEGPRLPEGPAEAYGLSPPVSPAVPWPFRSPCPQSLPSQCCPADSGTPAQERPRRSTQGAPAGQALPARLAEGSTPVAGSVLSPLGPALQSHRGQRLPPQLLGPGSLQPAAPPLPGQSTGAATRGLTMEASQPAPGEGSKVGLG